MNGLAEGWIETVFYQMILLFSTIPLFQYAN